MNDVLRIARLKIALQRAFLGRAILIFTELLRGFVKVLCIFRSSFAKQTKLKLDQDFKTYWSFCLEYRTEMAAFIISLIFKWSEKIKSLMAGSVCIAMLFEYLNLQSAIKRHR